MCMSCSPALCHFALCLCSSLLTEASDNHARCQFCHLWKRVSGAVHVLSIVNTNDSRGLGKQPVKCLILQVGGPTSCLYHLVAPIM